MFQNKKALFGVLLFIAMVILGGGVYYVTDGSFVSNAQSMKTGQGGTADIDNAKTLERTKNTPLQDLVIRSKHGKDVPFKVEVVDTPESRMFGLMHRNSLPEEEGMWFVFDESKERSFWMRNTLIPLDIIFVTENMMISHIHKMAVPLDETPIPSNGEARYVLEVNGGMSDKLGIQAGDFVRIEN